MRRRDEVVFSKNPNLLEFLTWHGFLHQNTTVYLNALPDDLKDKTVYTLEGELPMYLGQVAAWIVEFRLIGDPGRRDKFSLSATELEECFDSYHSYKVVPLKSLRTISQRMHGTVAHDPKLDVIDLLS